MIYAYAVDPEYVVRELKDNRKFSKIINGFGLGKFRYMLQIEPVAAWKSGILSSIPRTYMGDLKHTRIIEAVRHLEQCNIERSTTIYREDIDFIINAENEYQRAAYEGILACSNPRNHPAVLIQEDIDNESNSRFYKPHEMPCTRNIYEYTKKLESMLHLSERIKILDPFLNIAYRRKADLLEKIIVKRIESRDIPIRSIECYVRFKSDEGDMYRLVNNVELNALRIAQRLSLDFPLVIGLIEDGINEERDSEEQQRHRFHNRYILTNIGGVRFGDSIEDHDDGQFDEINLITPQTWQERWSETEPDYPFYKNVVLVRIENGVAQRISFSH